MNERVLVADDDEAVRRVIRRSLEAAGYQLTCARDGLEALALAEASQPDLILLDVSMPRCTGLEVLERLPAATPGRRVPVILLTGRQTDADLADGLERGADDYVPKPFSIDELRARVAAVLRRLRRDLAANPVTGLPGGCAIEEAFQRLSASSDCALGHADIDRFKSFNDAYGFAAGDRLIRACGELVLECVRHCSREAFAGHIGGDDFVFLCRANDAAGIASLLAARFDRTASTFYAGADAARGYVLGLDHGGRAGRFPLAHLSIGLALVEPGTTFSLAAAAASAAKCALKARRCNHSAYGFAISPRGGPSARA